MIKEALRPNFWRPVTDNDMGNDMNKTLRPWREAGRGANSPHWRKQRSTKMAMK